MCLMKVEYFIGYQFLGLEPDANGVVQQPRLIQQERMFVPIRAVDKIPQLNVSEESEAKLKGMLGDNGTGKYRVTMQSNNTMVGDSVTFRLLIDNSKSKLSVDQTRLTLHREIRAFAKTPAGEQKEFLDEQPVLKHHRNLKIAKQMPDLVAEDQTFHLVLEGNKQVECENHRFFYNIDYLDTLAVVC